ncbi:acyltransferase [Rhodoblastus sp.]|jgi:peptidoglycan/LPS O-acetylase OafA/YrhL|uniref:acyltransferase family protein n=1 Tax=Rhodoblastus sp. TaxID=1962975 RepID=UPI0025D2E762|nr:acyltransferase [Rhodoblastus sp.]
MKGKLEAIQALRFIAATAVVVDHALSQLVSRAFLPPRWEQYGWHCGQAGVWAFFAISGFIMIHAERENFGRGGGAKAFIAKRLVRIAPMYWLASLVALAALLSTGHAPPTVSYVAASLLFLPSPAQPGELIRPLLGQGWTLIYEMMFYCIFFCAMFLTFYRGAVSILAALGALVLAGSVIKPLAAAYDPFTVAAFVTDPIILLFGAGCVIGLVRRRLDRIELSHGLMAALILLGAAVSLFVAGRFGYPMNFYARAPFMLLATAAVAMCAFAKDRSSPSSRIMSLLGDASYSVYLFHLFFLNALFFAASRLPGFSRAAWLYVIAAVAAANAAGLVIHVFVEKPLTARLRDLVAGRRRQTRSAPADMRPALRPSPET